MNEKPAPKILIVDDVPGNLQVIATSLEPLGYDMSFAEDGATALATALAQPFDLILLDIMMPDMDGFEVCRRLKADAETADIPVIFITARTDVDSMAQGFESGGVDYVTKPFQVTELLARVGAHIRLRQRERELRTLSATKDRFIAVVGEDLKAPLGGIRGFIHMLKNQLDELSLRELRENLEILDDAAESYARLIGNLLDWSRIHQGKFRFEPVDTLLLPVVEDVVRSMRAEIDDKGVAVAVEIDNGLAVNADIEMLEMTLQCLIANAVKYSGVSDRISVAAEGRGDWIEARIADTGCGIAEDRLDQLFRIDAETRTIGPEGQMGTGMGLLLSKECIERHHGQIEVESKLDHGTTVRFTLPQAKQAVEW